MKRAGWGWFSAAGRFAAGPGAAAGSESGALVAVRRRFLVELQWQGRGGRFRHLAVRASALRRVAGALGAVAVLALALGVGGTFSPATKPSPAHLGVGAILNEHAALKARHDALRETAFDLADQLYARIEQGRRMVRSASTTSTSLAGRCPRPPARDASDEAILAWLSEQGAHLDAIGDELTAGRVEPGVVLASGTATVSGKAAEARRTGALQVAEIGSASRFAAPPAIR